MRRLLLTILLLSIETLAQNTPTIGVLPDNGPNLPTVCVIGQIYFRTATTIGLNQCNPANTWTALATSAGSGTVTNTGGALTLNAVMLGAGGNDSKVSTGITTNGASELDLGLNGTASGVLGLNGSTSGKFTHTPSATGAADSLSGQLTWPTGLGAIIHISGPTDQNFGINAPSARSIALQNNGSTMYNVSSSGIAAGTTNLEIATFKFGVIQGQDFVFQTAPTVAAAGCGGSGASVTANTGTIGFRINVGTSNTGACTVTLPTAHTGWNCFATDITTTSAAVSQTKQSGAGSTASVTLQNYTDLAATGAWTDSDVLAVSCFAF